MVRVQVSRSRDSDATVRVLETSDLGRLDLVLVGVDESAASRGLAAAGLGSVQDGYGWLEVEGLRAAVVSQTPSVPDVDPAGAFDGMVAYAASRGWTSENGRRLRAHCVVENPPLPER